MDNPHRFRIDAKADSATIYVYEEIGAWGVTAKDFAGQLKDLGKVKDINVRINSPGGDVFDGIAMYNLLASHPATVAVDVDGWAASAASVVAMAGDSIRMAENAFLMIHAPWTTVGGNAADLRGVADTLEAVETKLVGTYASARGVDAETIQEWVTAETWMTAQEAIDNGMADEITGASAIAASADQYRQIQLGMRQRPAATAQPEPPATIDIAAARRQRTLTQMRNRR